jgi:glycosyltransferase involved in cell wall biosynthesis
MRKYDFVFINKPVDYNELPKVYSEADILILPVDFNSYAQTFLKLSMPTKASEFMISGTPILLYCSPALSIYEHAKEHKWAYIVSEGNTAKIAEGILDLCSNRLLREQLGNTAREFVIKNYNAATVREKFRQILASCIQKK